MSSSSIQNTINSIAGGQLNNQFGTQRYALLFKPGTYNVNIDVNFFMQVLGLGQSPDNVTINGTVRSIPILSSNNATQNFWRSIENVAIAPSSGTVSWAVSQACPMRRTHVKGNLALSNNGWASGGFLGDSLVDGQVNSGTQQQWISRNDQWGSWAGANWNMVFVGDVNAPGNTFPSPPDTTVGQTPVVREKPFLTIDNSGNYSVFVPALRSGSQGTTWNGATEAGTSIPISQFYVAQSGKDTAASINAALAQGKNLLLTPGYYSLNDTLRVTNANTIVLGLGLATLHPTTGLPAMTVADVDGVEIGGVLFDAGPANSPVLLQVGPPGSSASHASNPTILSDIFVSVGGPGVGKATVSVQINSNNVVGDDFWIWRADHGNGVGWTSNTGANGVVVNGNNVTIYGLAVEHYQQYQTLWNGNGGQVYFYQSEAPYDPPSQGAWMDNNYNPPALGFASYKVADSVTSHSAYGVGVYSFFSNGSLQLGSAIEVPASGLNGAMFHDMMTFSGGGTVDHIINGFGNSGGAQYLVK
jgi:hypothetical protein